MIREASKHDLPHLIEMMRGYAQEGPVACLGDEDKHDEDHVAAVFLSLMAGRGFVLIDNDLRGMLAAIRGANVWCPGVVELRELAWYVLPAHRGATVGGRLWREFDRKAQKMLDAKLVDFVCTSVMATSPLIDYTRRGYQPLEATFFRDA
ncbi:MAG: hypothetical protein WBI20_14825 [Burkholderiaceae bacterium]